jgi:hypothetical protein
MGGIDGTREFTGLAGDPLGTSRSVLVSADVPRIVKESDMSITVNNATQAEVTLDTDTVDTIAILEADAALSSRPKRAKVTWVQEDQGEWIAGYGGYFGGSVDKRDDRYVASDTFGLVVGEFSSLEEAQTKLEDQLHVMLPPVIRPVE